MPKENQEIQAKEVYAILLDTRSIQKYIFAGNKLSTNVGASHLVEQIFLANGKKGYGMTDVLTKFADEQNWKLSKDWENSQELRMQVDDSIQCEIAYIGGGNMLILMNVPNAEAKCQELVGRWSKGLLVNTPGLQTGCAIGKLVLGTDEKFQNSLNALYGVLKANQNRVFPNVDLPYTGLTVECALSGLPANCYIGAGKVHGYVAASEKAKFLAYDEANEKMEKSVREALPQAVAEEFAKHYCFTGSIEHLGQKDKDEYIAVIHIDGNDMGVKFSACRNMQERKELSKTVAKDTKAAFGKLVQSIIDEYPNYSQGYAEEGLLEPHYSTSSNNKGKAILPIRPIIIGGDDITFVCPGKCGLIYAKRFMEALQSKILTVRDKDTKELKQMPFYSCAGIAIVPTKYPFFRAYELAEQLCGAAKKEARNTHGSSWLDFLVLHGESAADLDRIRENEYTGDQGNMHYGPYCLDGKNIKNNKRANKLIEGALALKKLPRSKVKALRDVISKDSAEIHAFMEQLRYLDQALPAVFDDKVNYSEEVWGQADGTKQKCTPYMDMVEIMDFLYDEREKKE